MTRRALHFNVAPRWTAGSPAAVSEEVALRVAREERSAHGWVLEGYQGESARELALRDDALRGIVERRFEFGKYGWLVEDVITGEHSYRPSDHYNSALYRLPDAVWRMTMDWCSWCVRPLDCSCARDPYFEPRALCTLHPETAWRAPHGRRVGG